MKKTYMIMDCRFRAKRKISQKPCKKLEKLLKCLKLLMNTEKLKNIEEVMNINFSLLNFKR